MLGPALAFELGFFAGAGSSFFVAKGFKLLNDQPSARAPTAKVATKRQASAKEANDFTARLLSSKSGALKRRRYAMTGRRERASRQGRGVSQNRPRRSRGVPPIVYSPGFA